MTFSLPQSEDEHNRERDDRFTGSADWLEQLYDRIPPGFFDDDPVELLAAPDEPLDTNWPSVPTSESVDWLARQAQSDPTNTAWLFDNSPNPTDPEFDTKVGIDLSLAALLADEQPEVAHHNQPGSGYDYLAPFLEADKLDRQAHHERTQGNLGQGQTQFETEVDPAQINQQNPSPDNDPDYSVPRSQAEDDFDTADEPPIREWLGITGEFDLDLTDEQAEVDFARRNSQPGLSPNRIMYVLNGDTSKARRERLAENQVTDTHQNTHPEEPPFLSDADYDPTDIDRHDISPNMPPLSEAQIEAELTRIEAELADLERDKPDPTILPTPTPNLDL